MSFSALIPHQTLNPTPTHQLTGASQPAVHARTSVCLPAFVVHVADALDQPLIIPCATARWAIQPFWTRYAIFMRPTCTCISGHCNGDRQGCRVFLNKKAELSQGSPSPWLRLQSTESLSSNEPSVFWRDALPDAREASSMAARPFG